MNLTWASCSLVFTNNSSGALASRSQAFRACTRILVHNSRHSTEALEPQIIEYQVRDRHFRKPMYLRKTSTTLSRAETGSRAWWTLSPESRQACPIWITGGYPRRPRPPLHHLQLRRMLDCATLASLPPKWPVGEITPLLTAGSPALRTPEPHSFSWLTLLHKAIPAHSLLRRYSKLNKEKF